MTGAPLPDTFLSLFQAADGRLWAGRHNALVEILPADDPRGTTFRRYTAENGLAGMQIWAMNEDRDGNLWLGSETRGVMKVAWHGFTIYTETDGLPSGNINLVPNPSGDLYVSEHRAPDNHFISQFNGRKFVWSRERWPGRQYWWGFTSELQDHTGEWWIPTRAGLLRLPATTDLAQLVRAAPRATYTVRDGLSSDYSFGLYEDARGDLWIAHNYFPPGGLTRWARADETFHRYSLAEDAPFLKDNFISAFGEDRAGQIWMGLWYGGLVRHRAGRFTRFTTEEGVPAGLISQIYRDRTGRLWVASLSGGVARLDDPAADRPRFVSYNRANGLASDSVNSITEDRWGRIYLATGRGINRIDSVTGQIKHYTTADGLPENTVAGSFHDRHGALWFVTRKGLARLDPELDRPAPPPTILISGVRIAGVSWPVSSLGQEDITDIEVPAHQNQVQIDFIGIHYAAGETLRYQYRLEGSGQDWEFTELHTMNLAGLSPGAYRLLVRAVSTDGQTSPRPAVMSFTILPPVWRRWWFLTLAGLGLGALLYILYHYRLAQAIKLERVRTRIATDLHDDIGASLSGMALLSDVIRRQITDAHPKSADMVNALGDSARRLVDAMSDIVWAIDPRRDDLFNLVTRIRQFAAQVLDVKGIVWGLEAPPDLEQVKLTPEERRHVFLIFKEALNNAARHASCRSVALALRVEHGQLVAEIRDDGRGIAGPFPPEQAAEESRGNGLRNMQARAAELGGRMSIDSTPGRGTRLTLQIPLRG